MAYNKDSRESYMTKPEIGSKRKAIINANPK